MQRASILAVVVAVGVGTSFTAGATDGPALEVFLPLGRTAYQTNEVIDVAVVRRGADGLQAGSLVLTLAGDEGGELAFTFPVRAASGEPAVATEHLHLNGWLLRPGRYDVRVACDGASAKGAFEVHSHVRRTSFKLIDWASRAAGREQAVLGDEGLGFNLMLYAYGGIDPDALIRGGMDYMRNCTMGGSNYLDLRKECDWSDPYVLGGGIARASRQAFEDRTRPNCLGVHLYDEPLLAEVKDPADPHGKRMVRHGVPAQERSFKAAFGADAPRRAGLDPSKPADLRLWMAYNRWRLLLLEAAWRLACDGVTAVRPDWLPVSQNQWAWQAFDEGYYFNVNRPFPVISRHALYDYKHGGDLSPSFAFEFGRVRELAKPEWYLPVWGCGRPDLYRAEQYLSFAQNLQGLAKPPDLLAHRPSRTPAAQGVAETNRLAGRLGTIFETMPVTRGDVAVLYSMTHNLHEHALHGGESYRGNAHFRKLLSLYLASKRLHVALCPVVEEDVRDGSLAAHHKAVIVAGVDQLPAEVVAGLEAFRAGGGAVLVSGDSKVHIKGATRFALPGDAVRLMDAMDRWAEAKQWDRWAEVVHTNGYFKAAGRVAAALKTALDALGVRPVLECDQPGVVASRQAWGDIEYLFAVNATPDEEGFGWYQMRPVAATLGFPADGRPVYDAVRGGRVEGLASRDGRLTGTLRFGPGQMRVFARTARPVGGVQVLTPLVTSDYTAAREPRRVEVNAALADDHGQVLCGSAPLHVEVTDPLGTRRYDLYRATDRGTLRLALPLAANDPPGQWVVTVRELLAGTSGRATFMLRPAGPCGAMAGAERRAVLFGDDRGHVFRFFRRHKELTLVTGTSPFDTAAAERLTRVLAPWDIRCKTVAASAVKRRTPTPAEKPTWVDAGGAYDLRGPAVLIGNPDDHPLVRHLVEQKFLPYQPALDRMPGRGRGLVAWQRDGLAYFGHESLTLVAYDAAGMEEAVGTAYELAAGMEPLTPWLLPAAATVKPANPPAQPPAPPTVAWRRALPDRPAALRAVPGGVLAVGADGTFECVRPDGSVAWQKVLPGGEGWALDATANGRVIALAAAHRLHVFDAGGNRLFEVTAEGMPQERAEGAAAVALAPDGTRVCVASAGYVLADNAWQLGTTLSVYTDRGDLLWTAGGVDPKTGKPKLAERCRGLAFAPDGKHVVATTEKQALVFDAASGKQTATLDGFNQPTVTPLGDRLLLADGERWLGLLAPAAGKLVGRLDCGKAGPVVFAPAAGGVVLGTEADGAVRLVPAVEGKLSRQTEWESKAPLKVVKQVCVHGDRVAVCYWGGTVRLLDSGGRVRAERVFGDDVAAIAWCDDRLVAGLADGSLVALTAAGEGREAGGPSR